MALISDAGQSADQVLSGFVRAGGEVSAWGAPAPAAGGSINAKAQRRKGARKEVGSALRPCAFASLRFSPSAGPSTHHPGVPSGPSPNAWLDYPVAMSHSLSPSL